MANRTTPITYRELGEIISRMSDQQKDSHVTLSCDGEYFQSTIIESDITNDVLDEGHPVIVPVDPLAEYVIA